MIQKNKALAIISSIIILLPAIFGTIFYNSLPDVMSSHFALDGTADGAMEKPLVVFLIPAILLIVHWLCLILTSADKRASVQNKKITTLIFFIMPATSLFTNGIIYSVAFDLKLDFVTLMLVFLGVLFALIGNYLPKVRRNRYMGIKIPYTLSNEQNWNMTHKFAGRLWFFGGIIILISALLPTAVAIILFTVSIFVMVIAPVIYSAVIHKRLGDGDTSLPLPSSKTKVFSIVMVILVLAFVAVLMFTGEVTAELREDRIVVDSNYYSSATVKLEDITGIEYRDTFDKGWREFGFGSARLSMGRFANEEFGDYTIYAYNKNPQCIVVTTKRKALVFNLETPEETKALYGEIVDKIS